MSITIVELPEFIRQSEKLFNAEEHDLLLSFLATNPTAGLLITGIGGIRKLRWAEQN
ncbi:MAG: hypothetical protein HGB23_12335 [Chlorobiaceae bacterium]|nr:hypothetical protein [Chlorobiaceae bacterium]